MKPLTYILSLCLVELLSSVTYLTVKPEKSPPQKVDQVFNLNA